MGSLFCVLAGVRPIILLRLCVTCRAPCVVSHAAKNKKKRTPRLSSERQVRAVQEDGRPGDVGLRRVRGAAPAVAQLETGFEQCGARSAGRAAAAHRGAGRALREAGANRAAATRPRTCVLALCVLSSETVRDKRTCVCAQLGVARAAAAQLCREHATDRRCARFAAGPENLGGGCGGAGGCAPDDAAVARDPAAAVVSRSGAGRRRVVFVPLDALVLDLVGCRLDVVGQRGRLGLARRGRAERQRVEEGQLDRRLFGAARVLSRGLFSFQTRHERVDRSPRREPPFSI